MSRALLIVICDFLLLSLLALVRFDDVPPPERREQAAANQAAGKQDLMSALTFALQEERAAREDLVSQLDRAEETLKTRDDLLASREERIQQYQDDLRRREEEARILSQQRTALESQVTEAHQMAEQLEEKLQSASTRVIISEERLAALQSDLRRRQEQISELSASLQNAEKSRQATEAEKQQLFTRLEVAQAEQKHAQELARQMEGQVVNMREEVHVVREEKQRIQQQAEVINERIGTLASQSGTLAEEIRKNRELAPNMIFTQFVTNRVHSRIRAGRKGFFGQEVVREQESKTVLVSINDKIYALFHIEDLPLQLESPGTDWNWLAGTIRRHHISYPIEEISFLSNDPRIVVTPVSAGQAERLGGDIYAISNDPFQFQTAVLVGSNEGYYGEVDFRLDPRTPGYVRMDRGGTHGLFGRFNPSRGDLVFSKTGAVIGVMVNNQFCLVLSEIRSARTIQTGWDIASQRTGQTLSQLRQKLQYLPIDLQ